MWPDTGAPMVAKKRNAPKSHQTTLRHLWLASLGLAVVARRESLAVPARIGARVSRLQLGVRERATEACSGVISGIESARAQVEPKVAILSAEAEARLAPVLDKLGLKKAAKPARKARKTAKKAAKPSAAGKKVARRTSARRRAA